MVSVNAINCPAALNALSSEVLILTNLVFDEVEKHEDIRAGYC